MVDAACSVVVWWEGLLDVLPAEPAVGFGGEDCGLCSAPWSAAEARRTHALTRWGASRLAHWRDHSSIVGGCGGYLLRVVSFGPCDISVASHVMPCEGKLLRHRTPLVVELRPVPM